MYPDLNIKNNNILILNSLKDDTSIKKDYIKLMSSFINYLNSNDLIFLQENYVSIFDRQKKFSLYLFEHIHGDSRDRGSAIIDLQNLYKNYNFEISECKELPDYIPLFLEFISLISEKDACNMLGDIINIISLLKRRLDFIQSPYSNIFNILENLSTKKPDHKIIEKILNSDKFIKNGFNIDKEWEEEKIF